MTIILHNTPPSIEVYIEFRAQQGWGEAEPSLAKTAIDNALFWVSAYSADKVIGFGRIIGDGALNYYVQDLIVHDEFQGCGIGGQLMAALMDYLHIHAKGATIGLMSVAGKEAFYEKYGFKNRPDGVLGGGMTFNIPA